MKINRFFRLEHFIKFTLALSLLGLVPTGVFAGSIERLIYYDANGTVSNFLAQPTFPNNPSFYEFADDHTPPVAGLQSKGDWQYYPKLFGSYTRGYLEAPASGNYRFFIASYNDSQLWLSTNETAAGKQLIAYETNRGTALFTGARLETRQSTNIALVRGQKYYLEVLHQGNSASNSFVQVGWQRPDGVQEVIPALHLAQYQYEGYGRSTYTAPSFNIYGYNGGNLPAAVASDEGTTVVLEADVIAVQPTTFKWYRNGVLVPGENLSYLQFKRVHPSDNGDYQFVVTNVYGALTSSVATVSVTTDTTAPMVTLVESRGNPNAVRVNYSEPVQLASATSLANYGLKIQGGASLVITQATRLPDEQSVQLAGAFNFQAGVTYQLTVANIQDQATAPNSLVPNPTTATFTHAPPTGTTFTFNDGLTNGFGVYGSAAVTGSGSYDGSGYLALTDAAQYQRGLILFSNQSVVQQFHLKFKTRIASASATPGDGFSVNLAADLPAGTFINSQKGYTPIAAPNADRLIVAFDDDRTVSGVVVPAITVKWQGNVITNVLTGSGGVPAIHSADGHWATVELQLDPGGNLHLTYDGVLIFTNLATGYYPLTGARLGLAAQTGVNYETHWFDDVYISYIDSGIGPVGFLNNPPLTNQTVLENQTAKFTVIPSGSGPFTYQWYHNGVEVFKATNSILNVVGIPSASADTTAGSYYVKVSNEFSQTNSVTVALTVTPDTAPPQLVSTRVLVAGNNKVTLTFNKAVDPVTATNTATYSLGLLPVSAAKLSADGLTVTLTTPTLELDQVYLLQITGLKDRTLGAQSLMTTTSFVTSSAASVGYPAQVLSDSPIRYWRVDEGSGNAVVGSLATGSDAFDAGVATFNGSPTLGVPGLVPSEPLDSAILLTAATSDWLLVPNGGDINTATDPIAKKSFEFWFNAASVPAPGSTGLATASTIYEEGAGSRGVAFYLWRDPGSLDLDAAQLIFHAWNNVVADGVGSGWGATAGSPSATAAVYVQTPVQAGQTYHVIGVLDGDTAGTNGHLILYVNGTPVGTVGGVGQLYAHTSDVEIGRGATLLHTGDNGTTARFNGVLDEISLFNVALSASTVALHYQAATNTASGSSNSPAVLTLSRLDTLGNPNSLVLTFNQPVSQLTATNRANYGLKNVAGTVLAITNITLLGGSNSVQLLGSFGFTVNSNYILSVSNLTDLAQTKTLTPNPTNVAFAFTAPVGTTFNFNSGLTYGVQAFGGAHLTNSGSYDGSGFINLTDAATNQAGAVLFTARHDINQAHISFKARLANASASAGAGFSVNIAPDLPAGTFSTPEAGYAPNPQTNRLTVAFNNLSSAPPSISVWWYGTKLTNVLTGANGIPPLNSADGHWAAVDINLKLTGLLSISFDGVTVITNLVTGFQPIYGGQVSFGARTTATAYETHWFDDVNLNFADGSIGLVTIPADGQPRGNIYLENQLVTLSVAPAGVAPFGYQWYFTNAPIPGATNRSLNFASATNLAGAYQVVVRNDFSAATSAVATVAVQSDLAAAAVTNIAGYAGGVNKVVVSFNKLLSPASATNLANFAINNGGLLIYSNKLSSDGITLTLFTSPQQNLTTNTLAIHNLLNYAAVPTALTTNVTFRTGISFYQETWVDGPVRYYRLDETNGTVINTDVVVVDSYAQAQGVTQKSPLLGVPALFTNSPGTAIQFYKAKTNFIQFQAKQWDVAGTNTGNSSGLLFTNHTAEFWFKANSLPYAENITDVFGNPAVTNHAVGLWSEGANARYFVVYLYGTDTTSTNPGEAGLYLNAGNIANDGPGAYQQWGTLAGGGASAVYVGATITTGVVYHVVAELEGRADTNVATLGNPIGALHLYTNGVWVGDSALPAGILYSHAGTNIRAGQGATNFRHDGYAFGAETFDGVLDDIVIYNVPLSPERVTRHYQSAQTPPLAPLVALVITPPVFGSFTIAGGSLNLNWSGSAQLQRATNVSGPFTTLAGVTSPYNEPATNQQVYFRLVQPGN